MKHKFAVQLYSLRKELTKDFPGVIRELKKQGWEAVQIDGLRGYSAEEIAAVLKETGLHAISMHANLDRLNNDIDNLLYEALLFGTKDIFCSSELTNEDDVFYARNTLINLAKKLGPLGFRIGHHNHDYEFRGSVNGEMIMDYITRPEGNLFLYPEIDTYWAKVGGADPFEYIKKFSGRIPMIHLKDMKSDLSLSYPESLAEIGTGCIDFLPFLKWGEENGIEYYIVEQDVSFLSGGMLESMAVSLENLIKLSEQL
jgi:sugar phosphate isomerase/epimerase